MKLIVIGIAGKAKSGKTTVAKAVKDHLMFTAHHHTLSVILSFADPLKDECAAATGLPREWFDTPPYKENLRVLMQWWGTEFRRNPVLGGDLSYWRDKAKEEIRRLYGQAMQDVDLHEAPPKALVVLMPDARFLNEADFIRSYEHGFMLKIEATGAEEIAHTAHASETELPADRIDFVFHNDHTVGTTAVMRIAEEVYERIIEPVI